MYGLQLQSKRWQQEVADLSRHGSNSTRRGTPRGAGVSIAQDTPRAALKEKTMAMSMGGSGASAPQMNVTPLIDVLLVLIIIFMVIVAQSKEKGLEAQIPQPPAHSDSVPPPVRRL